MAENAGTIDSLEIEISASSSKATNHLNKLTAALESVKKAANSGFGSGMKKSMDQIGESDQDKVRGLAAALRELKTASNVAIPEKLTASLAAIGGALRGISTEDFSKLRQLSSALKSMEGVKEINISSVLADRILDVSAAAGEIDSEKVNRIRELGESIRTGLGQIETGFTDKMRDVGNALTYFTNIKTGSINKNLPEQIVALGTAVRQLNDEDVQNLNAVSGALQGMAGGSLTIPEQTPQRLRELFDVITNLSDSAIRKIEQVTTALQKLRGVNLKGLQGSMLKVRTEDLSVGGRDGSKSLKESIRDLTKATAKATKLQQVMNSLGRVAFYRLIRSAIKLVTDALQEGTKNAYGFSAAFGDSSNGVRTIAEAYDQLASASFKLTNQLGAAWASLVRAVMPIILQFIDLVTRAANIVTQFFAAIAGSGTYLKAIDYNKKWGDSAKTAAKAAKEWKNQLMGFDEINRLEAPADPSGSVSGMETPDYGSMYEIAEVDSKIADIADKFNRVKELCKKHLDELKLVAYEGMLGIGLALLLTGANIPLGIGMIIAGGIGLAKEIEPNWDIIKKKVGGSLGAIELMASSLMFGIGLALAMSGANIPVGLGLMSLGALGIAGNFALNWDDMPDSIRRTIGKIELIVGGGMLAVGAALAFSGVNVPVGIGLMALGASALGAGVATDWDEIVGILRSKIGLIVEAISTGLLAIGAILVFSGANIPLGLGLMAVGALGMASVIAANWDTIRTAIENSLSSILLVLGTGSLVLGAILTLTGANIPLGIGLMALGATALGAAVAINWEAITEAMSGTLGILTMIAGGALAALGVILLLTGNIPLGIGLLIAGIGIFGVAAAHYDWDALGKKVREKLDEIAEKVGRTWDSVKGKFSEGWQFIIDQFKEHFGPLIDDVQRIFGGIQEVFQGLIDFVSGVFTGDWSLAWSGIKEILTGEFDIICGAIGGVIDWLGGLISWCASAISWLKSVVSWQNAAWSQPITEARIQADTQQYDSSLFLGGFATGGFPEDGLFMANHGELVGQFSNGRTAVANNEQITEGIASAVYDAFMTAFSQTSGNGGNDRPVNIYLDGKLIGQSTTKYQNQRARAMG